MCPAPPRPQKTCCGSRVVVVVVVGVGVYSGGVFAVYGMCNDVVELVVVIKT